MPLPHCHRVSAALLALRLSLALPPCVAGGILLAAAPAIPQSQRTTFAQSIRALPGSATDAQGRPNRAYITRTRLSAEELAAPMRFEVALAMRNFDELEARLAHSEIISADEMQARYLPLPAAHDQIVRWLESEGVAVTRTDANHLAIFARASVAEIGRVFQTSFSRVAADGAEFTSAVVSPSMPASLAPAVRGIHGLQPHQRLHRRPHALQPLAGTGSSLPYYPAQIAQAYNATGVGFDGTGQTIAVYALAYPKSSDLQSFWTTTGVNGSISKIQNVDVAGGPPASPTPGNVEEATLDVEWASALAPGATIRVYGASENDPVSDDELIQQVLADLPSQPTLHQLTISFGADEATSDRDYIAIEAQYMATLVSAGVTVFAASGDAGALGNDNVTIETGYPASMPDVTAVGGTTLTLDASGSVASEVAWGNLTNTGKSGASGGGISIIFNRPAWQNVAGAPAGTMRLVPDVAAVADPATGTLVVYNGGQHQIAGTSLATPIWAAWCALINQARASIGRKPLGALNPRIYPLMGTDAFRDITTGGNSRYQAGPGYDLCTGIGVPNITALLRATLSDTFAPVIEVQSGARFTTTGQGATFYVVATGAPTPAFRWQRLAAGSTSWSDLADNGTYSGTSSYALLVSGATPAMSGDQFRCVINNASGAVTSQPDTLTVAASGVSTLAGWPGWSGFADGQGSAARFNYTGSVRVGPNGMIYVADASNHTVRKITPAGVVTTVAGAPGVAGATDGPAATARFNGPAGVAIDAAGNIYVADSQNYTIRKISPDGVVSTIAGKAGIPGFADGTGAAANFYDPENLALGPDGNLYVADGQGNEVRKVTPAGVVTTLAGSSQKGSADGTGPAAQFNLLAGIDVDSAGNVYVGDFSNNTVRKITPAGVVTTLAGTAGRHGFVDGVGTAARFWNPTGLAVDASGNIYVADSNNNAIRRVTPAGAVATVAGNTNIWENIDGPLNVARFNSPADVAFDANGVLYVADALNCTVRRIVLGNFGAALIAANPQSATAALGSTLALSVATATGSGGFSYQWTKDGTAIAGATNGTYTVPAVTAASAGSYAVTVSSGTSSATSAAAIVTTTSASSGRLTNLSVRTNAGLGSQTLTTGFVLSGSPAKTLLIRGIGPALGNFGLSGTLADPVLTVLGPNSTTSLAATNDNWISGDATTMSAVGAFPLTPGSRDSAVVTTLGAGAYTAQIAGVNNATGLALAEVYDTAATSGAQLVNLSARAQVDTGSGVLIAGFAISGSAARTVLIRGVGPSLASFGVTGVLADPRVDVFDSRSALVQTNDNWAGDAALASAATQTGAFALSAASKDAALLVTLAPGTYTAQVSGVNGTTGVALIEIYEVGN